MKKRIIAILLSILVAGSSIVAPITSYATEPETTTQETTTDDYWPVGPEVVSGSAIVMEISTGTILYEKNIHQQYYPASITKIMTTLLALENAKLSETVTFSHDAVYSIEGTHIARDVDEQMTLEQTLYAVMLGSANECAYATAEHVGGDYDTFIKMMNDKATELGCQNTNFTNPHGLPDSDHYTSAYDMALISRAAMHNETFKTITATDKYIIPPTNKHDEETYIVNHHAMNNFYKTGDYIYEPCIGGKTGYTDAAGSTLVTFAEKDGMTLICVVMKSRNPYQYKDTTNLLEFCFNNFQLCNVSANETRYTDDGLQNFPNFMEDISYVGVDKKAGVVLPKTAVLSDAEATLEYGSEDGTIAALVYEYAGREVGRANLICKEEMPEPFGFGNTEEPEDGKVVVELNWKILVLIGFGLVVLGGIIFLIFYLRKNIYIIKHKIKQKMAERRKALHFKERKKRRLKRLKNRRE